MERLKLQYQDEKVQKFVFSMWDLLNSVDEAEDSAEEFLANIIFDNVNHPAIIAGAIYDAIEAKIALDKKIETGKIFEPTADVTRDAHDFIPDEEK